MVEHTSGVPKPDIVTLQIARSRTERRATQSGFVSLSGASDAPPATGSFRGRTTSGPDGASSDFHALPAQAGPSSESGAGASSAEGTTGRGSDAHPGVQASGRQRRRKEATTAGSGDGGDRRIPSQRITHEDPSVGQQADQLTQRLRQEVVDQNAWTEFVRGAQGQIYSQAVRRTLRRPDAEDDTQQAFERTFRNRGHVDTPIAYATTAMQSATADRARTAERRNETIIDTTVYDGKVASHEEDSVNKIAMQGALDTLPSRQRRVIELSYYQGLKQAQIAKVLGVQVATVRKDEARALGALRELFEEK